MKKSLFLLTGICIGLFMLTGLADETAYQMDSPQANLEKWGKPDKSNSQTNTDSLNVDRAFGKMPLYFIENQGQVDGPVSFYVKGSNKTIYFTSEGLTYVLNERKGGANDKNHALPEKDLFLREKRLKEQETLKRWVVKLDFVGARKDISPVGVDKTEAVISYFKGKPENWQTGLATYSRIIYKDLWPGIDLVYCGTMDRMKYDFIVHPGADPSKIRLAYRGASAVEVNEEGQMEVSTPVEGFMDDVPVGYQEVEGKRLDVGLSYVVEETQADVVKASGKEEERQTHTYGFEVGKYDPKSVLVLDPAVLVYCGYIGGSDYDTGQDIVVDGAGNVYVTGEVLSTEATFPVQAGPDLTFNGGSFGGDAFVAKVNAAGTALIYCGYIGGSNDDFGLGIAVDGAGNAYVTGNTYSTEATFPVNVGPGVTHSGLRDAFVAKVNAAGTALTYCGYIGGSSNDLGLGIAVDGAGSAYVTGATASTQTTFPVEVGPDLTFNGPYNTIDAFVAKVSTAGGGFLYCGYIGGSEADYGYGIAVDGTGNAYVTGLTQSTEATFPVTVGPDITHNGNKDAFVTKVNAAGTSHIYCGYIGGSSPDEGYGIAVDGAGISYVMGISESDEATFPIIVGPDLTHNGNDDAFVAKVNGTGTALLYCGYIGGSSNEGEGGIARDGAGNAYVTGWTYSTEATFPVNVGPDLTHNGNKDAFVAKVNASGTALIYCGYIGGSSIDQGDGIAVDGAGNAYIAGYTYSTEASFPVNVGPDLTHNSSYDAFVAKVSELMKDDFLGTWTGQGTYYRNSETGAWNKMASPASQIAAGDIDNDGQDDLLGIWAGQGGVWVKYSNDSSWAKLSSTSNRIAAGDMNGDGRDDLLGTWTGQGTYYRDSATTNWTQMASPASQITAGDIDNDGTDDLIGIWASQGGVWIKYSSDSSWANLSTTADWIAAGDMNGDGRDDLLGTWTGQGMYYRDSASGAWTKMATSASQITSGDIDGDATDDLIGIWPTQGGGLGQIQRRWFLGEALLHSRLDCSGQNAKWWRRWCVDLH